VDEISKLIRPVSLASEATGEKAAGDAKIISDPVWLSDPTLVQISTRTWDVYVHVIPNPSGSQEGGSL
jgi:hypothetical protein